MLDKLVELQMDTSPRVTPSHRVKELMLVSQINRRLGVVSAMNCKSGLDRTGFMHAITDSLAKLTPEEAADVIDNWDTDFRETNIEVGLARRFAEGTYTISAKSDEKRELQKKHMQVRKNILQHMLRVGLPITGVSTGVVGLKYMKGALDANPIPLQLLPPDVTIVNENGEEKEVRLTRIKRDGTMAWTRAGHDLIASLSQNRGA